jgi:hypothetical protein
MAMTQEKAAAFEKFMKDDTCIRASIDQAIEFCLIRAVQATSAQSMEQLTKAIAFAIKLGGEIALESYFKFEHEQPG